MLADPSHNEKVLNEEAHDQLVFITPENIIEHRVYRDVTVIGLSK